MEYVQNILSNWSCIAWRILADLLRNISAERYHRLNFILSLIILSPHFLLSFIDILVLSSVFPLLCMPYSSTSGSFEVVLMNIWPPYIYSLYLTLLCYVMLCLTWTGSNLLMVSLFRSCAQHFESYSKLWEIVNFSCRPRSAPSGPRERSSPPSRNCSLAGKPGIATR